MKRLLFFNWFKNISISKKLYFTVGIMAVLIIIELVILMFSINTLSSVRAYVCGEGLWSKAQKDAIYQLMKYGRTKDEKAYDLFLDFMKVPLADHKALVELSKPNPDMKIAEQGLIEGRNHPDDVKGMISLFTRFHSNYYISKAIKAWTGADQMVTEFLPISAALHKEIHSRSPSQQKINDLLAQIDPINTRLTVLEDEFSYTLGEGSRWLESLILGLLFAVALTVELTGLTLAIVVSRGIQKGLKEILLSAQTVAKGNFNRKATVYSKDEIGILANNFNSMSDELEKGIRQIEQAQKRFKGILESAPDAIIVCCEAGYIQLVNDECETLFGYNRDELIGEKLPMILSDRLTESEIEIILDTKENQKTRIEVHARKKNKEEFPVEISLSHSETEHGTLIYAAIRDISERKYIKELERKNHELEQFAYISSHDLQEPLNTIISFISLMEEDYSQRLDEDGRNYLLYIKESSKRMSSLITDLLEYSRLGHTSQVEEVNCNEIVRQVIADTSAKIHECKAEIRAQELPVIQGYNLELRLLFQNLISNAIKFRRQDQTPVIRILAQDEQENYHFSVQDNGIGIDMKQQEKIFIIFQRLNRKEEFEGTGIGLAHCKKIVELHGGKIWIESAIGNGSTFHFTLPKNN